MNGTKPFIDNDDEILEYDKDERYVDTEASMYEQVLNAGKNVLIL